MEKLLQIPTYHDAANSAVKTIKQFVTQIVKLEQKNRALEKQVNALKIKLGHKKN